MTGKQLTVEKISRFLKTRALLAMLEENTYLCSVAKIVTTQTYAGNSAIRIIWKSGKFQLGISEDVAKPAPPGAGVTYYDSYRFFPEPQKIVLVTPRFFIPTATGKGF